MQPVAQPTAESVRGHESTTRMQAERFSAAITIFAHRGLSASFPENTMAAFDAALDAGCEALELDVQRTRDGKLAVFHDDNLQRIAGRGERIGDLTYAALAAIDVGSWKDRRFAGERVPLLSDVLARWRGRGLVNVEMKVASGGALDRELAAALAGLLGSGACDVLVSSFDHDLLRYYRTLDRRTRLAVLFEGGRWDEALAAAQEVGAVAVHADVFSADATRMAGARAKGFAVNVYTVNDAAVARTLIVSGATGLFSDDAPALTSALGEES